MRFRPAVHIVTYLLFASVAAADDLNHLQILENIDYHRVESEAVGRPFHVYVKLPDGYGEAEDTRYPTVYVLDGGGLFPLMVAYAGYLEAGGEQPELIIVGISYGSFDFDGGNFRSTDYTAPSEERDYYGGAHNFQAFLKAELLPLIETSYRSQAGRRVIFGQSIAGQFVLFTAQTQPSLFWGHIASNPAIHRNPDFFLKTAPEDMSTSKLFVAGGTLDDARFAEPRKRWSDFWTGVEAKPWDLKIVDLDEHSHMSAPPASFRRGMYWLFNGD